MNLGQEVVKAIHRSPFILEALDAGIVNHTSLARILQQGLEQKLRQEISIAAISMAIKRAPLSKNKMLDKSISKFMSQLGHITIRSGLSDFSYSNSDSLIQCQARLLSQINGGEQLFYSFCRGISETTVICDHTLDPMIRALFAGECLLLYRDQLAGLSIKLPPDNLDTYGIYYTILKKLAWEGINLIEVLSTSHEITLVVQEQDVKATFALIMDLRSKSNLVT